MYLVSLQVHSFTYLKICLHYQWGLSNSYFLCHIFSATRSPKSATSQDTPYLDTSSVSLPTQKASGPAPLFPVDGIQ